MGRRSWRLGRSTRWLLAVPALLFAFFPKSAQAEVLPGLVTTYYSIDEVPPIQSEDAYPVCGLEVENNINRSYDGEPFEDCTYDFFMVQMTGFIQIPEHDTIEFWLASDDGGEVSIGGNTFGRWADQGCSATMSGPLELESGVHPLELWMYEHGGGTCLMLAWKIDDGYWEIVPEWAFTTAYTAPTTTTTTTALTTTVPATTTTSTTLQETSTTVEATTTTEISETSTTLVETTSTSPNTTTTTAPAPQPVWVPPATTTTEASTTTTTTSEPPTSTTVPVQTTEPVSTTVAPQTSIAPTTSIQASTTTLTVPDTTTPTTLPDTTTTIPTIQPGISNQQALQQVVNPSVVESLSTAEAEVLFAALDEESVTQDQAALIVQALDQAPDEVKEAFEDNVNVFSSIWSSYKMVGQTITVAERVTLVAVANTMGAATAVLRRRNG